MDIVETQCVHCAYWKSVRGNVASELCAILKKDGATTGVQCYEKVNEAVADRIVATVKDD